MYLLSMPAKTYSALKEAFRAAHSVAHGDISYLFNFRSEDIKGVPLEKDVIYALEKELSPLIKGVFSGSESTTLPWDFLKSELKRKNHILHIDEDAGWLISDISDFYARLHIGQLNYALERLSGGWPMHGCSWSDCRLIDSKWKMAMFGLPSDTSLGAGHKASTYKKDILFSLHQVIRHRLSTDKNPSQKPWNVFYNEPFNFYAGVPLSTISKM